MDPGDEGGELYSLVVIDVTNADVVTCRYRLNGWTSCLGMLISMAWRMLVLLLSMVGTWRRVRLRGLRLCEVVSQGLGVLLVVCKWDQQ